MSRTGRPPSCARLAGRRAPCALLLRPVAAAAAAGDLDPTFGDRGTVLSRFSEALDIAYAVGRQDDGAIVVAGFSETEGGDIR